MSCEPLGSALPVFSALVQFADELRGRTLGQPALPQRRGDGARAAGDAGAVHRPEVRLDLHDDHRAGRLRVVAGDERLVDPAARQLQAVGDGAQDAPRAARAFTLMVRAAQPMPTRWPCLRFSYWPLIHL